MKRGETVFDFNERFMALIGDEIRRGLKTPEWKAL